MDYVLPRELFHLKAAIKIRLIMHHDFEANLVSALPSLRRFARSLCRRDDVADDLVQTTVARAIASRNSFDPATEISPWLFRILRNAWIDMTRRAATRGVEIDIYDVANAAPVDGEKISEAALMVRETEAALATLPAEQREVIILVCYEELSYAEAAEILEIPRGTVMSRLARGRLALAEKLGIK